MRQLQSSRNRACQCNRPKMTAYLCNLISLIIFLFIYTFYLWCEVASIFIQLSAVLQSSLVWVLWWYICAGTCGQQNSIETKRKFQFDFDFPFFFFFSYFSFSFASSQLTHCILHSIRAWRSFAMVYCSAYMKLFFLSL